MSYTSYEEVIIRYPMLKSWGKTEIQVNSDLIYYAEMELNGRLASHFTVPFSASHPTVKDLTIDLAYFNSIKTRVPKDAERIHDVVIGRIDDIKEGKEYIYTGSGTTIKPTPGTAQIWSNLQDYHPVHTMLGAENEFTRISSERLEALEDVRD